MYPFQKGVTVTSILLRKKKHLKITEKSNLLQIHLGIHTSINKSILLINMFYSWCKAGDGIKNYKSRYDY